MEEVPASPVLVKQYKKTQKTLVKRKNSSLLNRLKEKPDGSSTPSHEQQSEVLVGKRNLSSFYYDSYSAQVETVNINPLDSAILLEKASIVPVLVKVPSEEFIACTNDGKFVTVAELAKRTGTEAGSSGEPVPNVKTISPVAKVHNYSFTQMEIDTQMIGIFEAADLLTATAVQNSNSSLTIKNQNESQEPLSPKRMIADDVPSEGSIVRTDPNLPYEGNVIQAILNDFHLDSNAQNSMQIDISAIRTENLRRNIVQLQSYSTSPPRALKRERSCRQYGRRNKEKSLVRRLSYDTDDSSKLDQPLSDDECGPLSDDNPKESDNDISMDGLALNSSVMIQANLTQLSAFFSQAVTSQDEKDGVEQKQNGAHSASIDREPTFCGFNSSTSVSPISLASDRSRSPKTVRLNFTTLDKCGDDSFQSAYERITSPVLGENTTMEHLLEDDEDLFMFDHQAGEKPTRNIPAQEVTGSSKLLFTNTDTLQQSTPQLGVGFNTARGMSIIVSETALRKAAAMFAEEESKMVLDEELSTNLESIASMPQHGEFDRTSATSGTRALEVEKIDLCLDPVLQNAPNPVSTSCSNNILRKMAVPCILNGVQTETPPGKTNLTEGLPVTETRSFTGGNKMNDDSTVVPSIRNGFNATGGFTGGFSTAGGNSISISKAALERAQKMFEEDDLHMDKENSSTNVDVLSAFLNKPNNMKSSVLNHKQTEVDTGVSTDSDRNINETVASSTSALVTSAAPGTTTTEKMKISCNLKEEQTKSYQEQPYIGECGSIGGHKMPTNSSEVPSIRNGFNTFSGGFAGGFSTAGGNSISISKAALERAQKMFDEDEFHVDKENNSTNMNLLSDGINQPGGSKSSVSNPNVLTKTPTKVSTDLNQNINKPSVSSSSAPSLALDEAMSLFAAKQTQPQNVGVHSNPLRISHRTNRTSATSYIGSTDTLEKEAMNHLQKDHPTTDYSRLTVNSFQGANDASHVTDNPSFNPINSDVNEIPRKRKLSFTTEDSIVTPTKKLCGNQSHSGAIFQTSTPAATSVKIAEGTTGSENVSVPSTSSTHDVDDFFAQLDDNEFQELLCVQPPVSQRGGKKPKQLLPKFDQCPDATTTLPICAKQSGSDWDDSFSEILPNLAPPDEKTKDECSIKLPEAVRAGRCAEMQKHIEFIAAKPEDACRPRLSSFCSRKLRKDRMSLKEYVGGTKPEQASLMTVAMMVTQDNVSAFRFNMLDYYGGSFCNGNTSGIPLGSDDQDGCLMMDAHSTIGVEEMRIALLASPGVDPRLVPTGWVENAWRWIVSKLSALERNFGDRFRGAMSPENVFYQLQYRYHVEIDCTRRPPLRKILEKDDIPGRRMVLFVSNIFQIAGPIGTELELSDGWYCVRTLIDVPLASAVRDGKITIGTKLMVHGAELLNHKEGCAPLDVPPDVRLRISANSSRRAKWDLKLGYYRCPLPLPIACNSIHERGGLIGRFRASVARVYPLMFVEKSSNEAQASVLRSERMQQRHSRKNDATQLENLHQLYNQVQREIESERASVPANLNIRVTESTTCDELQECLENGLDVSFLDIGFTRSQQQVIERFQQRGQEELQTEVNRRVKARLEKVSAERPMVTALLKVRLMDCLRPERTFLLSIWRPKDEVRTVLQEGNWVEFGHITANGMKNSEVQLTAHTSSTYRKLLPHKHDSPAIVRFGRCITPIETIDVINFRPPFGEFDTLGVVVHVGTAESRKFQSIYLADTAANILCVNFWHGLAEFAYDDLIRMRTILCVTNLQWRTFSRQTLGIPASFATEYTTFTEHPRSVHVQSEWERFHVQLDAIDREEFFQRCMDKVGELTLAANGSTPGTPLLQRSMSRLGQHSTPVGANNTTQRRIDTLTAIYGSPPKMSPIVIHRNASLRKGFKTPARVEHQPERERSKRADGMR